MRDMIYDITPHITENTWKGLGNITITRNCSTVDLSNAYAKFEVKSVFNLANPIVLNLDTENNGIVILDPPTEGTLVIPERIIDIPVGNYSWNLTIKLQTGEVYTYVSGNWKIIPKTPFSFNWQNAPRII